MAIKEILDFLIDLLKLLTQWQIIIFLLIFLTRKQLPDIMGKLLKNIKSIKHGDTHIEFINALHDAAVKDPNLLQTIVAKPNPNLLMDYISSLKDSKIDEIEVESTDSQGDETDNEQKEIERFLNKLQDKV